MDTPYSVLALEETDSTQDDARSYFRDRPILVVAGRQRRGRGRSEAPWWNAPRAVAASLAFRPHWPESRLPLLSLLAGVGASRTVGCDLKWPNDLWIGRKVGGLLVEVSGGVAVCGMGLNLWWPDPPPGVGALYEADPGPSRGLEVARAWADELLALASLGPDRWPRDEYRRRCVTLGRRIRWEPDGEGTARDVDPDGGLVVETESGPVTLRGGTVRHVRQVDQPSSSS
ncbi:MAG: hypothetical protein KatS3mg011_1086 [Acidimicrobiia bacterium]|nr:MAG: hypothetical protein KatS3mg011_1086 [Acidimicrobiia bacterium]